MHPSMRLLTIACTRTADSADAMRGHPSVGECEESQPSQYFNQLSNRDDNVAALHESTSGSSSRPEAGRAVRKYLLWPRGSSQQAQQRTYFFMVAEPVRSALIFLARTLPSLFLSPPGARDGDPSRTIYSARRSHASWRADNGDTYATPGGSTYWHHATSEEAECKGHGVRQRRDIVHGPNVTHPAGHEGAVRGGCSVVANH